MTHQAESPIFRLQNKDFLSSHLTYQIKRGEIIPEPTIPTWIFLFFSRTLAFFTIFAEGIFIIALARILNSNGISKNNGRSIIIVPAILFVLLFILLFLGEYICGFFVKFERGYNLLIYRVAVWDFLATLYALLEGIICILAARLYIRLKRRNIANGATHAGNSETPKPLYNIWIMVAIFIIVFGFFEYSAIHTAVSNRFAAQGILNMARFYRIIMGWFWTAFEALVAIILIKMLTLKKHVEIEQYAGH